MADSIVQLTPEVLWCALNAARIERGISWRTLAKEAGTSASTVSRMPAKSPSVDSFLKLLGWLAKEGFGDGCEHDGAIMYGGIGTLDKPPSWHAVCLQCGRTIPTPEPA